MNRTRRVSRVTVALFLFAVGGMVLPPAHLAAQSGTTQARSQGEPDFLFSAPRMNVTIRTGVHTLRANGQFYDFVIREFTAERDAFRGAGLGVELGIAAAPRVEVLLALDGAGVQVSTESRDWEEADGRPIRQATRIRVGPSLQGGVRMLLIPRSEQISGLAWIPNPVVPFVTGGAGVAGYELRQWGDFVDTAVPEIFAADFVSSGASVLGFAGGGVDVRIGRALSVVLEGRYQWSRADLDGDFFRFEPLDLSGLRLTAGLSVRF
jgi:hypothetical protein